jgi:DNA repair photolyase
MSASWIMLRLPLEVADLWQAWLAEHYPARVGKVMGLLRDMHGGAVYSADWHRRMRGTGPYAEIVARRFDLAVRRLGLETEQPPLRCDLFRPPAQVGDQLSLF